MNYPDHQDPFEQPYSWNTVEEVEPSEEELDYVRDLFEFYGNGNHSTRHEEAAFRHGGTFTCISPITAKELRNNLEEIRKIGVATLPVRYWEHGEETVFQTPEVQQNISVILTSPYVEELERYVRNAVENNMVLDCKPLNFAAVENGDEEALVYLDFHDSASVKSADDRDEARRENADNLRNGLEEVRDFGASGSLDSLLNELDPEMKQTYSRA